MILAALREYAKQRGYKVVSTLPSDNITILVSDTDDAADLLSSKKSVRSLIIIINEEGFVEFLLRMRNSKNSTSMIRLYSVDPAKPGVDLQRELKTAFRIATNIECPSSMKLPLR